MSEKSEKPDITIANPDVVTKYQTAAGIVNNAMKTVIEACKPDAKVSDICELGDKTILKGVSGVYNKKKTLKGVAYPTSLSVNNIACHFSPLSDHPQTLKKGDIVKIEMGAHIDGFPAMLAHTIVVDEDPKGRVADAILAAYNALEAALRVVQPGRKNSEVTEVIQKVAETFNCKPLEGMLSQGLVQNDLESAKSIILNPSEDQKRAHETVEFALHEVYNVDVLVTTGDGKSRALDNKLTTIFKKTANNYSLKLKASRETLSQISNNYGNMAFNIRSVPDAARLKLGMAECIQHELIVPYDIISVKEGEVVAQFSTTVLLMPSGSLRITECPIDVTKIKSEFSLSEEHKALIETPLRKKKNK